MKLINENLGENLYEIYDKKTKKYIIYSEYDIIHNNINNNIEELFDSGDYYTFFDTALFKTDSNNQYFMICENNEYIYILEKNKQDNVKTYNIITEIEDEQLLNILINILEENSSL